MFGNRVVSAGRKLLAPGFVFSAFAALALLAACDGGTSGGQEPASDLARGKAVYARYCNVCHPGGGAGSGPSLTALAPRLTDEQIEYAVRQGKKRMPGYKTTDISDADLDGIVVYIRSLK